MAASRRNPYVGPRPFERNDHDLFYGRAIEAQSLTLLIVANRTLLVYAQSGAGKTSLLNARVIPMLEERGFEVMPVARVSGLTVEPDKLSDQSNVYIANTVISLAGDEADITTLSRLSLRDYLDGRQRLTDEDGFTLPRVLIFDQLEELFTAYPQFWREREAFFKQVEDARRHDSELHVVFTMREDYIARLDSYIMLFDKRLSDRFRLDLLDEEGALDAVRKPLLGTGVEFAPGVAEQLVSDLLQIRVESETGGTIVQPGEYIEPVQLQIVCQELWNGLPPDTTTITAESLSKFGNVNEALTRFYRSALNAAVERTKADEGILRAWFEKQLITPAGTRGFVYQGRGETGGISNATVEVLEDLYIIRPERRAGARWFELTHDRLIEPILNDNRTYLVKSIAQEASRQARQSVIRRLIRFGPLVFGLVFLIGILVTLLLIPIIGYNNVAGSYSERINTLASYRPEFKTVRVLDAAGNQIAEFSREEGGSRESITLAEMSPEVIFAIVGAQDPNYYETSGPNAADILRTFVQSLGVGGTEFISTARTTVTSFVSDLVIADTNNATQWDETVVASELSRRYDKNVLLEVYLSQAFFGNQSYGVEAASQFYFDKPASEVNLVEATLLASLLRDPIGNDPIPTPNRDQAFDAADAVLRELTTVGCLNFQHGQFRAGTPYCIDGTQILRPNGDFTANINLLRAQMQTRVLEPRSVEGRYPHFVDFVRRELIREYGDEIFRDGYEVRTTLVPEIQDVAERALRDQVRAQAFTGIQTGAVLVTRPETGEVLAMVGSPDFNNLEIGGQTNYALTWQMPGATILPIVYIRALEGVGDRNGNGRLDFNEYLTAATVLFDLPRDFQDPEYTITNADGQYRGAISLRMALANSLRVPAVKAYNFIGNDGFVDVARRMGLTFLTEPPVVDHRTGIGDVTEVRLWDMMKAYGTLANTGRFAPLRVITQITNSDGQPVPLAEALAPRQPTQVISPQVSFLVQNILSDAQFHESGFAPLFLPNYPGRTAAKINYLDNNTDMWAIGFSRDVVVGVWMGRPDKGATIANSRDAALPVWTTVMGAALNGINPLPFNSAPANLVPPGSVQILTICAPTGTQPGPNCPQQRNEYFAIMNPPPTADEGVVVTLQVDSWTGVIANEFCRDNVIQAQFIQLVPDDPYVVNWLNTPAGRATANRMGLPENVLPVPTRACDLNTELPTALISSPVGGTVLTGTVSILGAATASTFDSYQLEYAPVGSNTFTLITGPVRTPQPNENGVLGEWDTTRVPNGQYVLRLTISSRSGGFARRDVQVTINNLPPTPGGPTSIPVIIPTVSTAVPTLTPTATLSFGG